MHRSLYSVWVDKIEALFEFIEVLTPAFELQAPPKLSPYIESSKVDPSKNKFTNMSWKWKVHNKPNECTLSGWGSLQTSLILQPRQP